MNFDIILPRFRASLLYRKELQLNTLTQFDVSLKLILDYLKFYPVTDFCEIKTHEGALKSFFINKMKTANSATK